MKNNQNLKQSQAVVKEKQKKGLLSNFKKLSTSKLLILFLFINCTLIQFFTGYVILRSLQLSVITGLNPDLSPLTAIIGAVIGQVIGYAIYAIKSTKQNCVGGIVFEKAMLQQNNEDLG